MAEYCDTWGLKINSFKAKFTICSRGKVKNLTDFRRQEIVYSYKYLGVHFNYNSKFTVAKNELYSKGSLAMLSLLRKCSMY